MSKFMVVCMNSGSVMLGMEPTIKYYNYITKDDVSLTQETYEDIAKKIKEEYNVNVISITKLEE